MDYKILTILLKHSLLFLRRQTNEDKISTDAKKKIEKDIKKSSSLRELKRKKGKKIDGS